MNAIVLVKLPKIPLLPNKKSQTVHGISSLSQVMGLAAYKVRLVIGSVYGLTLVPECLVWVNTIAAVNTSFCKFKVEGRQIYTINTIIRIATIVANTGNATGRVASSCLYYTGVYHD